MSEIRDFGPASHIFDDEPGPMYTDISYVPRVV